MLVLVPFEEHAMKKAALIILVAGTGAALAVRAALHDKGGARPVETVRVSRADIGAVVKATGVVKLPLGAEVRLGAQVPGLVRRLAVDLGDTVVKGQHLAEIKVADRLARRAQAQAALSSALANHAFAAADLGRKRGLLADQALAPSELEVAERAFNLAAAAVAEARANVAYAETQVGEASIVAPISGVVAQVAVRQGETVTVGPALLTLMDLQRLEVWAYVDETDIGRIAVGQPARFSVDAYPGQEFEGRVAAIYPKPEIRDNVVNYVAVVRFPPPQQQTLRPEMTANVRISLAVRAQALAVPRRAVRRDGGRAFVLCPQGQDAVRRYVTTGSRDESNWEILDGLTAGEVVLLGDPAEGKTD
jgi:RND family efflux transporter MFP subunit